MTKQEDDILINGNLEFTSTKFYMDYHFLKRLKVCLSLLFGGWCYFD